MSQSPGPVEVRFWHELNDAQKALYQLNATLQIDRIHVPENLARTVEALVSALNATFISYEMQHEAREYGEREPGFMKTAQEEIKRSKELAAQIETQIRALQGIT